jgi:hypothetical protein
MLFIQRLNLNLQILPDVFVVTSGLSMRLSTRTNIYTLKKPRITTDNRT